MAVFAIWYVVLHRSIATLHRDKSGGTDPAGAVGSERCDGRIPFAPANAGRNMTMVAITLNDYAAAPSTGVFARLLRAFADYRAFVETRSELRALNDRELADLGIARFAIDDIARDAVSRA
jgi:uncharacterized protein YjiS (DUF1127 family)